MQQDVRRLNVDVTCVHSSDGQVQPKAIFIYKTQSWLPVQAVLRVDRAANLKVGGQGVRYHVVTLETGPEGEPVQVPHTLWREGDIWFVEERIKSTESL